MKFNPYLRSYFPLIATEELVFLKSLVHGNLATLLHKATLPRLHWMHKLDLISCKKEDTKLEEGVFLVVVMEGRYVCVERIFYKILKELIL